MTFEKSGSKRQATHLGTQKACVINIFVKRKRFCDEILEMQSRDSFRRSSTNPSLILPFLQQTSHYYSTLSLWITLFVLGFTDSKHNRFLIAVVENRRFLLLICRIDNHDAPWTQLDPIGILELED